MPRKRTSPRPRLARACIVCGATFSVTPSKSEERACLYCSRACFYVALRQQKVPLQCRHCGAAFGLTPSRIKRGEGRFCSVACHVASAGTRDVTCHRCGVAFQVWPHQIRNGRRFCGTACRDAAATQAKADRFWSHVEKSDGCWLWTRVRDAHGYGRTLWHGGTTGAHRVAYRLTYGDFDPRLLVLHDCDNPPCVRPDHLHLGTPQDNAREASDRRRYPLGDGHPGARLTSATVREIRRRAGDGAAITALAREYGVGFRTIRCVVRRETWRHVE